MFELVTRAPASGLRPWVMSLYGYEERAAGPVVMEEGPAPYVPVIVDFGPGWLIDGERRGSFAAGLSEARAVVEHAGHGHCMQFNLTPLGAHGLFGLPMHELAGRCVPLDALLEGASELEERLYEAGSWSARLALLENELLNRLAQVEAPPVAHAWKKLVEEGGRTRIGELADDLGWSHRRLIAEFRDQVGLRPKQVANVLRFDRASRMLGEGGSPADVAFDCGYSDQAHLTREFTRYAGRTPGNFLQDAGAAAA
ncbi:MAG: helix-turn-helix transcriptional regulator [Thermoleophilaceae bacterium]|nr:helix-turn-helix transcriptional regulator [Thermoleophilaceae bacterium]